MKNYQITISSADLPYVMEAITLRALTLQQSINNQIVAFDEADRKRQEEARRAALPDPFDEPKPWEKLADKIEKEAFSQTPEQANAIRKQIFVTTDAQLEHAKAMEPVSRKAKRAALMRILKAKGSADLSTAEIARRAGVSYVTAMKARAAFATPAKKGRK